ncbi:hypothetical protein FOZ60_013139 [Perkinsus olseni]|uniref:Integrase catalytic domain-containing protein n=1 Tax=Perkinsus olseni TaxID=32597 RepID=A0A7J6N9S4_PEROL|nr:hypothetical protein FOZ60_013139 [Perkinsus olseni]
MGRSLCESQVKNCTNTVTVKSKWRAPTPQVDHAQTTGQHQATADPVPTWPLTSTSSQPPPGPLLTRCPPAQEADNANQPPSLAHDELFDYTVSYNAFDQAAPTNEPCAQSHETSLPRSYHYTGQAEGYSSPRFPTEYSFARPTSAEKQPHQPPTSANEFITVLSANGEWRQIPLTPTANTGADDNIPHSELNRMAVQATNMGELWTKNNPPFTGSESDCTTTTSLIRRWERFCQVQWQSPTAPVAVRSFISFALNKALSKEILDRQAIEFNCNLTSRHYYYLLWHYTVSYLLRYYRFESDAIILLKSIYECQQGTASVSDFLEMLTEHLLEIQACAKHVDVSHVCLSVLRGLREPYNDWFYSACKQVDPHGRLCTIDQLFSVFREMKDRARLFKPTSMASHPLPSAAEAFNINEPRPPSAQPQPSIGPSSSTVQVQESTTLATPISAQAPGQPSPQVAQQQQQQQQQHGKRFHKKKDFCSRCYRNGHRPAQCRADKPINYAQRCPCGSSKHPKDQCLYDFNKIKCDRCQSMGHRAGMCVKPLTNCDSTDASPPSQKGQDDHNANYINHYTDVDIDCIPDSCYHISQAPLTTGSQYNSPQANPYCEAGSYPIRATLALSDTTSVRAILDSGAGLCYANTGHLQNLTKADPKIEITWEKPTPQDKSPGCANGSRINIDKIAILTVHSPKRKVGTKRLRVHCTSQLVPEFILGVSGLRSLEMALIFGHNTVRALTGVLTDQHLDRQDETMASNLRHQLSTVTASASADHPTVHFASAVSGSPTQEVCLFDSINYLSTVVEQLSHTTPRPAPEAYDVVLDTDYSYDLHGPVSQAPCQVRTAANSTQSLSDALSHPGCTLRGITSAGHFLHDFPWRPSRPSPDPRNLKVAIAHATKLYHTLSKRHLQQDYADVFNKYSEDGLIVELNSNEVSQCYYTVHFPVITIPTETEAAEAALAGRKTRIRPVFDWRPANGLQGVTPVIDRDLVAAITVTRSRRYALWADLKAAFLHCDTSQATSRCHAFVVAQDSTMPQNQNLSFKFFRSPHPFYNFCAAKPPSIDSTIVMSLTENCKGLKSPHWLHQPPSAAATKINNLIRKNPFYLNLANNDTLSNQSAMHQHGCARVKYQDDFVLGGPSQTEVEAMHSEDQSIVTTHGHHFSNHKTKGSWDSVTAHGLGLVWTHDDCLSNKRVDDDIYYKLLDKAPSKALTVRQVLSAAHKCHDPLGYASWAILPIKKILRKYYMSKTPLDSHTSPEGSLAVLDHLAKFNEYCASHALPRYVDLDRAIVLYSDSSAFAIGAYICGLDIQNPLCCLSKLVPLDMMHFTIVRKETIALEAALSLLTFRLQFLPHVDGRHVYILCDSSIVVQRVSRLRRLRRTLGPSDQSETPKERPVKQKLGAWEYSHCSKVADILDQLGRQFGHGYLHFAHCPGKLNPADCFSPSDDLAADLYSFVVHAQQEDPFSQVCRHLLLKNRPAPSTALADQLADYTDDQKAKIKATYSLHNENGKSVIRLAVGRFAGEEGPLFVPINARRKVIEQLHCSFCHRPAKYLIDYMEPRFYFHNLKRDVRAWNRNCVGCQVSRGGPTNIDLKTTLLSHNFGANTLLSIDWLGPVQPDPNHGHCPFKYILHLYDPARKFNYFALSVDKSAVSARKLVADYIWTFGSPHFLVADCDRSFIGKELTSYAHSLGIKVYHGFPHTAHRRAYSERIHQELFACIRAVQQSQRSRGCPPTQWHDLVKPAAFILNSSAALDDCDITPNDLTFLYQAALPPATSGEKPNNDVQFFVDKHVDPVLNFPEISRQAFDHLVRTRRNEFNSAMEVFHKQLKSSMRKKPNQVGIQKKPKSYQASATLDWPGYIGAPLGIVHCHNLKPAVLTDAQLASLRGLELSRSTTTTTTTQPANPASGTPEHARTLIPTTKSLRFPHTRYFLADSQGEDGTATKQVQRSITPTSTGLWICCDRCDCWTEVTSEVYHEYKDKFFDCSLIGSECLHQSS